MRRVSRSLALALFAALGSGVACTLIADVDRDKIGAGDEPDGSIEAGAGGVRADASSGGTSGGGGRSQTGGSGGGPGGGGTDGGPVEAGSCVTPADCGADTLCTTRTCTDGGCGVANVPSGTPTASQAAGDCKRNECDGNGAMVPANDDTDVEDDSNPCTVDGCNAGTPTHTPEPNTKACGTNDALRCDGAGTCAGCTQPSQCPPGTEPDCSDPTCDAGQCGLTFVAGGTVTPGQVSGDCHELQCDGSGAKVDVVDDADVPDDGNACTDGVCNGGIGSQLPATAGTACTGTGVKVCDGSGTCVACVVPADCAGSDTDCASRVCTSSNTCDVAHVADGTPVTTQVAGDCKRRVCDGAGSDRLENADSDLPDDSNLCTNDLCNAGQPSHTNVADGQACGSLTCTGGVCQGCSAPTDCPAPASPDCATRTCTSGACGFDNAPDATPVTSPTGDCKKDECDGNGNVRTVNDDTDRPVDGMQCTDDVCQAGTASNPDTSAGAACTESSGRVCDGSGACVACNDLTDCPVAAAPECALRTCTNHVCGFNNFPQGTVLTAQTAGDCRRVECDGNGATTSENDNTDEPEDNLQCTNNVCAAGTPSNPPKAAGTACNQSGGNVCNASGDCVACGVGDAAACPGDAGTD